MSKILIAVPITLILFFTGCGDKNEYVGDLTNDLPDGKGVMTYKDGSSYDGEWKKGKRYGKGKFIWPNGQIYIGKIIALISSILIK